eukprot:gnl/TRDRNA2_/TRDRNA2_62395_c0_seq1.p1 gnl/TRDRNA2_/TRDRNA2_62395_c0~~gnl/TRDRNA2_/TRDRNA2_62395_c0_seq1.p1  ORF type:complete len:330 (+),score=108.91 gnl/TRDRNA2_/TRDRNA2_62395_c0_seq1:65-1054(+)
MAPSSSSSSSSSDSLGSVERRKLKQEKKKKEKKRAKKAKKAKKTNKKKTKKDKKKAKKKMMKDDDEDHTGKPKAEKDPNEKTEDRDKEKERAKEKAKKANFKETEDAKEKAKKANFKETEDTKDVGEAAELGPPKGAQPARERKRKTPAPVAAGPTLLVVPPKTPKGPLAPPLERTGQTQYFDANEYDPTAKKNKRCEEDSAGLIGACAPPLPGINAEQLGREKVFHLLSQAEKALCTLEGRVAGLEETLLQKGAVLTTADQGKLRAELAQLEARARALESDGVDSILTSRLTSGKEVAYGRKRGLLRRLEILFDRIDSAFQRANSAYS